MGLCASVSDRLRKRSLQQSETQEQTEAHTHNSRGPTLTTATSTARDARAQEQVTDAIRLYLRGPDGTRSSAYQRHVPPHGNQALSWQPLNDLFEMAREMDRELMAYT